MKTVNYNIRIDPELRDSFNAFCRLYGVTPSKKLRELMEATVENRIIIKPRTMEDIQ